METTSQKELTSESAAKITAAKKLIEAPGAYLLKVTNVHHYTEGAKDVHIVNLQAMTAYHEKQAREYAEEGMFQEACNQNLSASQRPQDYIPSKGEIVKVNVDWVDNSEGIPCLFVTSLTEVSVSTAKRNASLFVTKQETAEDVKSDIQPKGALVK